MESNVCISTRQGAATSCPTAAFVDAQVGAAAAAAASVFVVAICYPAMARNSSAEQGHLDRRARAAEACGSEDAYDRSGLERGAMPA